MTEPYTNARPMKNIRRLMSWMGGVGCALVWIISPFACSISYSLVRFIPQDVRLTITENIKSIPVWVWVIVGLSVLAGFFTGRDIVRWLYKE